MWIEVFLISQRWIHAWKADFLLYAMLSFSYTSVLNRQNMDPLFVRALLVFSEWRGKRKNYIFLFCSFYTQKRRSIKLAYFCWSHGFFALIRLLRELPASHPLGTQPWFDMIPPIDCCPLPRPGRPVVLSAVIPLERTSISTSALHNPAYASTN